MRRRIDLKEYTRSEPQPLSVAERDALDAVMPDLALEPVAGAAGTYHLTPGPMVGAIEIGDLSVFVEPKIGIPQLLSLVCYATGGFEPRRELFDYPRDPALADVLALALGSAARRAFRRGLLHGYRGEEDALHTVRGRIRLAEQIRRRHGVAPPVEVGFDEFTDDIPANRLVKAAARRLGGMQLRSLPARRELGWIGGMLANVSAAEYAPHTTPEIRFDRLNEHYREVVGLARLVLLHSAFEAGRGDVRASGFILNMNDVFQRFVTEGLRQRLGLSVGSFGEKEIRSLDESGDVHLRPDLTWRQGASVVFVGDAKYKNLGKGLPSADIYQLLAYVTAADLPGGLLIYAKGEAEPAVYSLRGSRRRLEVVALDLSGTLDDVLERLYKTAARVKALRDEATARPDAA
jgi:5-methylcytosine-specific restriction enzyme subunit McrC